VNGPQVLAPIYEKKVGRPKKSRRKQPHEVQGKHGPKMTKHGVVMHCRYCQSDQHNQATCEIKKLGLRPKQPARRKAQTVQEEGNATCDMVSLNESDNMCNCQTTYLLIVF